MKKVWLYKTNLKQLCSEDKQTAPHEKLCFRHLSLLKSALKHIETQEPGFELKSLGNKLTVYCKCQIKTVK